MLSTYSGEYILKKKSTRRSWNLILNGAVGSIDKPDRDDATTRYTSYNWTLTSYLEKGVSLVKFVRRWSGLDVSVVIMSTIMALKITGSVAIYPAVTDIWNILTGHDCPD